MNGKSTGILLTTAAVLFAFIWLVDRPIRQERERDADRVILPGFNPTVIDHIELKPRGADEIHVMRVEGSNGVWQMTQPISYPAQSAPIKELLDALGKSEWRQRISAEELKDVPDAQEKYGFAPPEWEISLEGGGVSRKVMVGQSSALGDQVFLEVVGRPEIYLIDIALVKLIPVSLNPWRDLTLINLEGLPFDSIRMRSSAGGYDLEYNMTNRLWFMTNPVTARADNDKISDMLGRLQTLRVHQFATDDPQADLELYGLQTSANTPALDLSLLRGTNVAAELQVGTAPTNETGMVFARRTNPSNIVLIAREAVRDWQSPYTNLLDYHFISLPVSTITSIAVQDETPFTIQKETNGQWQVKDDPSMPVDAGLMADWLSAFTNIETRVEKTVATDLQPYGLQHPLLQYTLVIKDGGAGPTNASTTQIDFGVNARGNIFERRMDESSVNTITADDFIRLPHAAWQLRDRRVWNINSSNVVSLTVTQRGATRKYLRDPSGDWTFAPGYDASPLVNWHSLEEGIDRLSQLRAVFWTGVGDARRKELGFDKARFSVALEVKEGDKTEIHSIEFGRSPYSYPYAAVTANGKRFIFEFPVDLYENFVEPDMSIYPASRGRP